MINCAAIDDEPWALSLIREYVGRIPEMALVATFEDGIAGRDFLIKNPVDLVFLDINMPDINGVNLASSIPPQIAVVFTTAHRQYAYEGFELEAVDYLLKPFSFDRFSKAIEKVLLHTHTRQLSTENNQFVFVWSEYQRVKIFFKDIIYVEAREDYSCYHLRTGKIVMTLQPLKKAEESLPISLFARTHRSYIVSLHAISAISGKKIMLLNAIELPVGKSYIDTINKIIENNMG